MEKYGRWTVLREVPSKKRGIVGNHVECQCECGNIKINQRAQLKHANGSRQCIDCMYIYRKKRDPATLKPKKSYPEVKPGDVFGDLTVIRTDTLRGFPSYLCKCTCGREYNIYPKRLTSPSMQHLLACLNCYRKRRYERATKSVQAAKGKYYNSRLGIWAIKKPC